MEPYAMLPILQRCIQGYGALVRLSLNEDCTGSVKITEKKQEPYILGYGPVLLHGH